MCCAPRSRSAARHPCQHETPVSWRGRSVSRCCDTPLSARNTGVSRRSIPPECCETPLSARDASSWSRRRTFRRCLNGQGPSHRDTGVSACSGCETPLSARNQTVCARRPCVRETPLSARDAGVSTRSLEPECCETPLSARDASSWSRRRTFRRCLDDQGPSHRDTGVSAWPGCETPASRHGPTARHRRLEAGTPAPRTAAPWHRTPPHRTGGSARHLHRASCPSRVQPQAPDRPPGRPAAASGAWPPSSETTPSDC